MRHVADDVRHVPVHVGVRGGVWLSDDGDLELALHQCRQNQVTTVESAVSSDEPMVGRAFLAVARPWSLGGYGSAAGSPGGRLLKGILNRSRPGLRGVPGSHRFPLPCPASSSLFSPRKSSKTGRSAGSGRRFAGHSVIKIGTHAIGDVAAATLPVHSDRRISALAVRGLKPIHQAVVSRLVPIRIIVGYDSVRRQAAPF